MTASPAIERGAWRRFTDAYAKLLSHLLSLSVLVLALLAVPMARTSPRQPRYGNLILAVLGYIIYANSLALGRLWMAQGKLSALWGFWWVYLPTLVLAIWLIRRGQRLRQKRSAR